MSTASSRSGILPISPLRGPLGPGCVSALRPRVRIGGLGGHRLREPARGEVGERHVSRGHRADRPAARPRPRAGARPRLRTRDPGAARPGPRRAGLRPPAARRRRVISLGRPRQLVAAVGAAPGADDARPSQFGEDVLEEVLRDLLALASCSPFTGTPSGCAAAEFGGRPHRIVGLRRDPHAPSLADSADPPFELTVRRRDTLLFRSTLLD